MGELPAVFGMGWGAALAVALPPGPVTAESLRRAVSGRGYRPVLLVQVGSLIGDLLWAGIGLGGVALFLGRGDVAMVLRGFGALVLLTLALKALRTARAGPPADSPPARPGGAFATGALLSLSSPSSVGFWLGVGSTIPAVTGAANRPMALGIFLTGYLTALLLWIGVFSTLAGRMGRFVSFRFFRWASLISALALAAFGVRLASEVFG